MIIRQKYKKINKDEQEHFIYHKLHQLRHIAQETRCYSLPVLHQTFRWERKHQIKKNYNRLNKNNKDLCNIMMKRNRFIQAINGHRIEVQNTALKHSNNEINSIPIIKNLNFSRIKILI